MYLNIHSPQKIPTFLGSELLLPILIYNGTLRDKRYIYVCVCTCVCVCIYINIDFKLINAVSIFIEGI